jgi:hypothetical protein
VGSKFRRQLTCPEVSAAAPWLDLEERMDWGDKNRVLVHKRVDMT